MSTNISRLLPQPRRLPGGVLSGACPFCHEQRGVFSINQRTGWGQCRQCHVTGPIEELDQRLQAQQEQADDSRGLSRDGGATDGKGTGLTEVAATEDTLDEFESIADVIAPQGATDEERGEPVPSKQVTHAPDREVIPTELIMCPQWVMWREEARNGRSTKVPYSPRTGRRASVADPTARGTYQEAVKAVQARRADGIGYVFVRGGGLVGVDLDDCRDLGTGAIEPWARKIIMRLNSYTEVSPSGTGVHIYAKGSLPSGGRKRGPIEMYDSGRFFTVTGKPLPGTPSTIESRQAELMALHAEVFGPSAKRPHNGGGTRVQATGLDDAALIEKALRAKNGEAFSRLWRGDWSGYPSQSEADLALCSHLAFWTHGDGAQIDRLYRQSALYRPKWDERHSSDGRTYGELTIAKALSHAPSSPKSAPQAQTLVALAVNAELFHAPDGDTGYATVPVGSHHETWPIRSKSFRRWLTRRFYDAHGKPPGAQAVADVLCLLEAKAQFDGPKCPVFVRVAEANGAIYLDLANEAWEAVEITVAGWRIVADPPVKFRRPRGMLPLPRPLLGGSLDDLRGFVNVATDSDWMLFVAWLVAVVRGTGPYPVLVLHGEQGAGKSTRARVARMLLDPNSAPLRAEPRDERDAMIAATNSWVLAFDNLSHLEPWQSDAFCRLATGGGFSTRELYSDMEEMLFDAQRPIILNGIEELATRGDLLDRSLILCLPQIPNAQRRPERAISKAFEEAHPRILGALLTIVSSALRNLPTVSLGCLPRMADFAEWVTAAEPALGWSPGAFMEAYTGHLEASNELALEASPVAGKLQEFMSDHPEWTGTATELLETLIGKVEERRRQQWERLNIWPTSAKALSNTLRRLAPNLRAIGIEVIFGERERSRSRRRLLTIRWVEQEGTASSVSSTASSQPSQQDTREGRAGRRIPLSWDVIPD